MIWRVRQHFSQHVCQMVLCSPHPFICYSSESVATKVEVLICQGDWKSSVHIVHQR